MLVDILPTVGSPKVEHGCSANRRCTQYDRGNDGSRAGTSRVFFGPLWHTAINFCSPTMNSYFASLRGSWTIQRAVTFRAAAFQVGAIVGPILGGWIANTAGLSIVFRYSAALC